MLGPVRILFRTIRHVARDLVALISLAMRSRAQLAAENLFLRKQLALYVERQVKPRRADHATRITLVALSRFVEWRHLLTVVTPETPMRWHRKAFRLWWRWRSRAPGRPPIPVDLQQLIATMAASNRTWGEEQIAAELLVKPGIRVSPRTVWRYLPSRPPRARPGTQAWSTFVRNHARSVLATDFFVVVTATFRAIYLCVVLEVGTRRILQGNVTEHPTADWTAQQFRMIVPGDHGHRFVIHDRDTIDSDGVDRTLEAMGLTVLKTPARVPQANTSCERVIGPHSSLGPGLPDPPSDRLVASNGHQLPDGQRVVATAILGGSITTAGSRRRRERRDQPYLRSTAARHHLERGSVALMIAKHRQLARLTSQGRYLIATKSGDWIEFDEPDLVVNATREMVERAYSIAA